MHGQQNIKKKKLPNVSYVRNTIYSNWITMYGFYLSFQLSTPLYYYHDIKQD